VAKYDLAIKGATVVIPVHGEIKADIGIVGEKIAAIADIIPEENCERVIDASGKYVFPGAIDSHSHVGIYRPLDEDAKSESASAALGGVTTIMSYFRTGKSYLNKVGGFKEIFPELIALSEKAFITDYAYHIALMTSEQLKEIDWLVSECGVTTFKYYMFYKSIDLAGSSKGSGYLMLDDNALDFGFLYRFMKEVARVNKQYKDTGGVRLSIHCENPEIIKATVAEVQANSSGNTLRDYSNGRPGWQEELAIKEAAIIANQTDCPVNLLHLTSKEAIDAGKEMAQAYPHLDILLESTLHHLALSHEDDYGILGKVNPPIRTREDVDYLWKAVAEGYIDTAVSDHATSSKEFKKGDLWNAMPGFGGFSLMFPVIITEGYHKRGVSLKRLAEISAYYPAVYHHLYPRKGTIMVGSDADLAIIDLENEKEATLENIHSAQDFSPFEGLMLKGWPETTVLRGKVIFENGQVIGKPGYGTYLKRPPKK